jgi:hypothetical protein
LVHDHQPRDGYAHIVLGSGSFGVNQSAATIAAEIAIRVTDSNPG